ncbi:MAG: 4Fe-4S dicluster domain-containing protein [Kiritimatiellae bacterium]|nr:4Fe-4S dicluster domain-containing protein [Kiritimatiellia bacterium]MBQ9343983.1 4Fe-4S dicluster domain-containing protein [Kiritimatiellia bacterium]
MPRFPLVPALVKNLFKRPLTNPFPAAHLPPSVGDALATPGAIKPPVPMPPGGRARVVYDPASCVGCQMCIKVCPAHAIEFVPGQKKVRLFRGGCIACGQCVEVCAKKSLSMDGQFLLADTNRFSDALVAK